ncbi:MAG: dehydratase [Alphaproteobacteria bacterium]|jgi:acyl dehydratase|nr:dehydratase [Alphaproteobacteria bacterium]
MLILDQLFDEVSVGDKSPLSPGRTMTEADVVNFCMLTGNWVEIHTNVEYAKHTPFKQRLVQGSLVFSVIPGLVGFGRSVAAFYGIDKLRFVKPVFIGDTVYVQVEVIAKREKDDRLGVVTRRINVQNQRGELVQTSEQSMLTHRARLDA